MRHGGPMERERPAHRHDGYRLHAAGERQAERAGRALARRLLDVVLAGPLVRSRHTPRSPASPTPWSTTTSWNGTTGLEAARRTTSRGARPPVDHLGGRQRRRQRPRRVGRARGGAGRPGLLADSTTCSARGGTALPRALAHAPHRRGALARLAASRARASCRHRLGQRLGFGRHPGAAALERHGPPRPRLTQVLEPGRLRPGGAPVRGGSRASARLRHRRRLRWKGAMRPSTTPPSRPGCWPGCVSRATRSPTMSSSSSPPTRSTGSPPTPSTPPRCSDSSTRRVTVGSRRRPCWCQGNRRSTPSPPPCRKSSTPSSPSSGPAASPSCSRRSLGWSGTSGRPNGTVALRMPERPHRPRAPRRHRFASGLQRGLGPDRPPRRQQPRRRGCSATASPLPRQRSGRGLLQRGRRRRDVVDHRRRHRAWPPSRRTAHPASRRDLTRSASAPSWPDAFADEVAERPGEGTSRDESSGGATSGDQTAEKAASPRRRRRPVGRLPPSRPIRRGRGRSPTRSTATAFAERVAEAEAEGRGRPRAATDAPAADAPTTDATESASPDRDSTPRSTDPGGP